MEENQHKNNTKNRNIIYNIKNTWIAIYYDYKKKGLKQEIFTTDGRLLYIGLTFIIVTILIAAYDLIFNDDKKDVSISNLSELRKILK